LLYILVEAKKYSMILLIDFLFITKYEVGEQQNANKDKTCL